MAIAAAPFAASASVCSLFVLLTVVALSLACHPMDVYSPTIDVYSPPQTKMTRTTATAMVSEEVHQDAQDPLSITREIYATPI